MSSKAPQSAETKSQLEAENEALRQRIVELERANQESEKRFATLVGGSIQGIMIHKKFKPLFVNDTGARMFGFDTPEQVMALSSLLELVAPSERLRMQELGAKRLSGGDVPDIYEIECLRRNGATFWVEHIGSLIDWFGQIATLSILVDITKRKQLDNLKSEFVSTVSHELRTPLTSIRGSLGLIIGGAVGDIPTNAIDLVDIADKNCGRLIRLVNDILDMEKIESGMMDYTFAEINLPPLIDEIILANKSYGDEFNVKFVNTISVSSAHVLGDKERLSQVLANLLSNAAKFSPPGGDVEISITENVSSWRVGVTDHGDGVPEEFRHQIFERFSQADASDTRRINGTGLGLSISRAIVEKHGGKLDFTSKRGEGATFYFDLPAKLRTIDSNESVVP